MTNIFEFYAHFYYRIDILMKPLSWENPPLWVWDQKSGCGAGVYGGCPPLDLYFLTPPLPYSTTRRVVTKKSILREKLGAESEYDKFLE